MSTSDQNKLIQDTFSARADFYKTSLIHKDEEVLGRMVELSGAERDWLVLDVACGTGHTALAFAPHTHEVIGLDLTQEMLVKACELRDEAKIDNVDFCPGEASRLPYNDNLFDLITCRRACHHFVDLNLCLQEMRRVLKPGSILLIDDRSIPEDNFVDSFMNEIDFYHDRSHIREYRASEWQNMLFANGFAIELIETYQKLRPLSVLTGNAGAQWKEKIDTRVMALSQSEKEKLGWQIIDGQVHFYHWYVLIKARK